MSYPLNRLSSYVAVAVLSSIVTYMGANYIDNQSPDVVQTDKGTSLSVESAGQEAGASSQLANANVIDTDNSASSIVTSSIATADTGVEQSPDSLAVVPPTVEWDADSLSDKNDIGVPTGNDTNTSNSLVKLEQHFAVEDFDSNWINPIEAPLTQLFQNTVELSGSELLEARCQSTLCRVEVSHQDNAAENNLIASLGKIQYLAGETGEIVMHRLSSDESFDGRSRTIFFVARLGHSLPN